MKTVCTYTTGSQRGYICVANRGVESQPCAVPSEIHELRGNTRRAMELCIAKGATYYTVSWYQGVPHKGYSNQYCYAVYTGYNEED